MLYNPKWGRNIHRVPNLIAWLEMQDLDRDYCYVNPDRCMLTEYYRDMGLKKVRVTPVWLYHDDKMESLPSAFDMIARDNVTFGGALESARQYHWWEHVF
jgi:hypothetical protein